MLSFCDWLSYGNKLSFAWVKGSQIIWNDIFFVGSLPMIDVKLLRSKGMILDCPHPWDCCNYNNIIVLNIYGPVHRNQSHSLKILSAFFTTSNTRRTSSSGVWGMVAKPVHTEGLKYLRRSREILFPKVPCSPPVILSGNRWFWRHKPSWCPPLALLFVLELFPIQTTDEIVCLENLPEFSLLILQILFLGSSHIKVSLFQSPVVGIKWKMKFSQNTTLCLACFYSL